MNDEIVAALEADEPVPEAVLAFLAANISKWDCEEWDARIGHAIIARLRRERARAEGRR